MFFLSKKHSDTFHHKAKGEEILISHIENKNSKESERQYALQYLHHYVGIGENKIEGHKDCGVCTRIATDTFFVP